jgi:hypothetical protein
MKRAIRFGWAAVALVAMLLGQEKDALTGSISGTVVDEKGRPLEDVAIHWYRSVVRSTDTQAPEGSALTDKNGNFSFTGLGAATYLFCNQPNGARALVGNCAWTRKPPSITLKAGEKVTGYQFTVQAGARVEFEMDNSAGALPLPETEKKENSNTVLPMLVGAEGEWHTATLESRSDTALHYVIVVPPKVDLTVKIQGTGVQVSDEKAAIVNSPDVKDKAASDSFQMKAGDAPKKFKFTVKAAGK